MVDIGMEAFLPGSQIDNKRIKNLDEYIGKHTNLKFLKSILIVKTLSFPAVNFSKRNEFPKKLKSLRHIQARRCPRRCCQKHHRFRRLPGSWMALMAFLHITDMTWKRIKHPSEMVQLGQKLEVMILKRR